MKLLIALLAVAGLSGCVAYGGGATYGRGAYYENSPSYYTGGYYRSQPYYYGGTSRRDTDRDAHNRYPRDRHGDGVSDRHDAHPNNPYRR